MNSKIAILCFAVLVIVSLSEANDKKEGHHGKGKGGMKCLGEDLKLDDAQKAAWKECHPKKEDHKGDGEGKKHKKGGCMMDCMYRKMGYITSEGKLDKDKIEAGIKKSFPEAAQAGMIADVKKCEEEVTETLTTDDDCKTFHKYTHCYMKAFKTNCHKGDGKKDKHD